MKKSVWLLLLLVPRLVFGAVTEDATTTATANGMSSWSWTHAVGAGADLAIFCEAAIYDFITGSTITANYNSVAMTHQSTVSPVADYLVKSWRRVLGTSSGSASAQISSDQIIHFVGSCRSYKGVHQSSPIGAIDTDSNAGSEPLSTSISVESGGIGHDAGFQATAGVCSNAVPTGSGQVEKYDLCEPVENGIGGFGSVNLSAGTPTHSYNLSAGSAYVGMLAFPIRASAGGGGGTSGRSRITVVD